jgi:ribosome maturation factor RimP
LFDKELQQLLAPVVITLGYELVGVVRILVGGHKVLVRVYIDHPQGIDLDDCERVSNQVSGVIDVNDLIKSRYTLEVSSPGLDRPLFTLDHFLRFVGRKIKVHLTQSQNACRNFTGQLQRVQDHNVIVVVDGMEYSLPYERIDKAHLVPE